MGPPLADAAPAVETAAPSPESEPHTGSGLRGSLALLGGATAWDPRLDDYQWSVTPHAAYGAQVLAGTNRYQGGIRGWRSQSRQQIDPGSSTTETTVHATSLELVGRARLASRWGTVVSADVTGGWLRLGYSPDRAEVATGSGTVEVEFRPIDTWVAGFGFAFERSLGDSWSATLALDQRVFGLEAAHRNGSTIEVGRERFLDWGARLELAKNWEWR